jgi:hypothetical protein
MWHFVDKIAEPINIYVGTNLKVHAFVQSSFYKNSSAIWTMEQSISLPSPVKDCKCIIADSAPVFLCSLSPIKFRNKQSQLTCVDGPVSIYIDFATYVFHL